MSLSRLVVRLTGVLERLFLFIPPLAGAWRGQEAGGGAWEGDGGRFIGWGIGGGGARDCAAMSFLS